MCDVTHLQAHTHSLSLVHTGTILKTLKKKWFLLMSSFFPFSFFFTGTNLKKKLFLLMFSFPPLFCLNTGTILKILKKKWFLLMSLFRAKDTYNRQRLPT